MRKESNCLRNALLNSFFITPKFVLFRLVSIEKLLTADGSHTLFSSKFNEIYHSRHGAIQESNHVFVQHGLMQVKTRPIRIFELGFGTGLNAFLAFLFAQNHSIDVHYEGVELYPIENDIAQSLNYADELCAGKFKHEFLQLHTSLWNQSHQLSVNFTFIKKHISIADYQPAINHFDVIFFDAFAPDVQSELWSEKMFAKMYAILKPGGILCTYCAKGIVRRAMQGAGFVVQRQPGPPGKREMLVAFK